MFLIGRVFLKLELPRIKKVWGEANQHKASQTEECLIHTCEKIENERKEYNTSHTIFFACLKFSRFK